MKVFKINVNEGVRRQMDFFGVCTTYMDSLVLLPFVYLPNDTCFKDGHNTQPPMSTNNMAMESSHVHKEIHFQLVHFPLLYFPSACTSQWDIH